MLIILISDAVQVALKEKSLIIFARNFVANRMDQILARISSDTRRVVVNVATLGR
jgi:hypothetical protein